MVPLETEPDFSRFQGRVRANLCPSSPSPNLHASCVADLMRVRLAPLKPESEADQSQGVAHCLSHGVTGLAARSPPRKSRTPETAGDVRLVVCVSPIWARNVSKEEG